MRRESSIRRRVQRSEHGQKKTRAQVDASTQKQNRKKIAKETTTGQIGEGAKARCQYNGMTFSGFLVSFVRSLCMGGTHCLICCSCFLLPLLRVLFFACQGLGGRDIVYAVRDSFVTSVRNFPFLKTDFVDVFPAEWGILYSVMWQCCTFYESTIIGDVNHSGHGASVYIEIFSNES